VFGRNLFSFTLACTAGVFWEFAEVGSDTFLHTHIQRSVDEAMRDLIADASGAALMLLGIHFWRKRRNPHHGSQR